jgi:hypothetical protein
MFSLLEVGMFWLLQLAVVAANPLIGAIAFGLVIALLVLVFKRFGWLWGLGTLTLLGLVSGPALILTPVIVVVTLLARFHPGNDRGSPGSETKSEMRPILLEPRDANRSR